MGGKCLGGEWPSCQMQRCHKKKLNYIAIFIHYRARGDCHIWHSDNVPAGGADPGLLYDGAPGAESKEKGDGDAEEDSEGWRRPVQLLLNYQNTLQVDF